MTRKVKLFHIFLKSGSCLDRSLMSFCTFFTFLAIKTELKVVESSFKRHFTPKSLSFLLILNLVHQTYQHVHKKT